MPIDREHIEHKVGLFVDDMAKVEGATTVSVGVHFGGEKPTQIVGGHGIGAGFLTLTYSGIRKFCGRAELEVGDFLGKLAKLHQEWVRRHG